MGTFSERKKAQTTELNIFFSKKIATENNNSNLHSKSANLSTEILQAQKS